MSTVKTEVCHVINTVGEQHTITRGIYRKELDLASSPGLHLEPLPGNKAKLGPPPSSTSPYCHAMVHWIYTVRAALLVTCKKESRGLSYAMKQL